MASDNWNYPTPPGGGASAGGEANRTGGPPPNLSGRLTDGRPVESPLSEEAATRLAEIRAMRKADPGRYWSSSIQDEELRLLSSQGGETAEPEAQAETDDAAKTEALAAKAEPAAKGSDDELAQVTARLKEIRHARKANPRSIPEKVEAEELALLDRREVLETGAEAMPPDLIEVWRKQGGLKFNMERARAAAAAMLADVGEGRDELMQSIDSLPPGALSALYSHLALDAPTTARPASASALQEFADLGAETAALLARWGKDASRRLGAAQSRFSVMLQSMPSPADQQAARDWLDGLSPSAQAAVAKALAGA
jgi:hypothetical protein